MRKIVVMCFILLLSILIVACQKDEIIESRPIGYGLLSDDYVGSFQLFYISEYPYNINELTLTPYYLPHIWAQLDINDPLELEDYVITVEFADNTKYYAKYLLIGSVAFIGELEQDTNSSQVKYYTSERVDIMDLLEDEDEVKWYIEQINAYQVMMTNENGATIDYKSVLDDETFSNPYQRARQNSEMMMLNWNSTLEELPRFPSLYASIQAEYQLNTQRLNDILQRAYDQRENPEYLTTRRSN